jgi:hypothetical protein
MCLACEQDAIWFAYLESRGLLKADDPAAAEAFFADFPVQPLPPQAEAEQSASDSTKDAGSQFSCDDPTAK